MNRLLQTFVAVLLVSIAKSTTQRYSSGCSVPECALINNNTANGNSSCSNPPPCYRFETSTNTVICAPQVMCTLFDACSSTRTCPTRNSVCVVNSCCSSPICVPLSVTGSCTLYTTNAAPVWSASICPNATWGNNGTVFISNSFNGSYVSLTDFVLDKQDDFYIWDAYSSQLIKVLKNDTSRYTTVLNNTNNYYLVSKMAINSNGTIFTAEYGPSGSPSYYRVSRYVIGQSVSSSVIFGPVSCGSSLNELCSCTGLAIDSAGSIYYSDYTNHRVVKFQPYATSVTVVAGTSGSYGSGLNQLYYPSGIALDSAGSLYVADQSNYRVMKYTAGNSIGTLLFTTPSYQSVSSVAVDNGGAVYAGSYNGLYRYIPSSGGYLTIASSMYWGIGRIWLDTAGNIFASGYSSTNIYRYNITSNYC